MLKLQLRPYRRKFRQPLRTSHGLWSVREGAIIKLEDTENPEQVGYGEIAPLPWFGTETLAEAIAYCQTLPPLLSPADLAPESPHIRSAPGPAMQFGLGSAAVDFVSHLRSDFASPPAVAPPICQLLPTGARSLQTVREISQRVSPPSKPIPLCFKWKIGVDDPKMERQLLRQLCSALPNGAQIRLDANGGLTLPQAQNWLTLCDELGPVVEFLEQPLASAQFEAMQRLADQHRTAIALDESVTGLTSLQDCHAKGWRGIFVVKGAIAGHPQALLEFCQAQASAAPLDLVFSSVFETAIARRAVWNLAAHLNENNPAPRALGFGVDHWLEDDGFAAASAEEIWQALEPSAVL